VPATCHWPTALITWGPGSTAPCHAHRCIQVTLAVEGHVRVRQQPSAPWRRCGAVVIPGDVGHEIDASGSLVLTGFIASAGAVGATLSKWLRPKIGIVPDAEVMRWRRDLGDADRLDADRARHWITSSLVGTDPVTRTHPAVDRAMAAVYDRPLERPTTSLLELSENAGLSTSRFAHVFSESMGMAVRPYLRWLRLQCAARELVRGRSATDAALMAGFSDVAHLTRTFRRMLGSTPRELAKRRDRSSHTDGAR
jgi:AraC-like DNA-binding protein